MRTTSLSLGLAVVLGLPVTATAFPAGAALRLKVNFYAYAQVSESTLADARATAGRILRKAGIDVEWLDCPTTDEDLDKYPACEARSKPATPTIKLIDGAMARRLLQRPGALGFALLSEQTGYGTDAWVFLHRVREAAGKTSSDLSLLLASAIAHELGHLLLGAGQHSRTGIMRGDWNDETVKRAERGELVFTPQQARRMRAQLVKGVATGTAGVTP